MQGAMYHLNEVLHDRGIVCVAIREVLSPFQGHGARGLDQPARECFPAKLGRLCCEAQEVSSLALVRRISLELWLRTHLGWNCRNEEASSVNRSVVAANITPKLLTARPSTSYCGSRIQYYATSALYISHKCRCRLPRLASGWYDMCIFNDYCAIKYLEYKFEEQSVNFSRF